MINVICFNQEEDPYVPEFAKLTIENTLFEDIKRVQPEHGELGVDENYSDEEQYDEDDDEDDYDYDYDDVTHSYQKTNATQNLVGHSQANSQTSSHKVSSFQPGDKLFRKYTNRISVEHYEGSKLPNHAVNTLLESNKRADQDRFRAKDKHDRATAEQVRFYNSIFINNIYI